MSISSIYLDAFLAVARRLHFSRAAEALHITQSALSQRILNLEKELHTALFIRGSKGIRLTETGLRLLRYSQSREHLEKEFLEDIQSETHAGLGGLLRVAGYSTIMPSVVMPALAPLLRENPRIRHEFRIQEIQDIPELLLHGETDFALLDRVMRWPGIESRVLGYETYIMVESSRFHSRFEIYLDHTPGDETTEKFLRLQGAKAGALRRCYVDDIQGLIRGVEMGLGKAAVPRHLIPRGRTLRVTGGYKPMTVPVVLHYFAQPFYSKLHRAAIEALAKNCRRFLDSKYFG